MTTGHIDDDDDDKQQPPPSSSIVHMLIDSESKRKEAADNRPRYHPSRGRLTSASAVELKEEKQPSSPFSAPGDSDDSDKENQGQHQVAPVLLPPRRFRPLFLRQWLDVRDQEGTWLEAQVVELSGDRALVHYKGYKHKYDEWLPLAPNHPLAARIAPLHTHTRPRWPQPDRTVLPLSALMSAAPPLPAAIDCLDTTEKWLPAHIIDFDRNTALALVSYDGWQSTYDEWINIDSYRIAQRGTHTSGPSVIVNVRMQEDDSAAVQPLHQLMPGQRRKSQYVATQDGEGKFRAKLLAQLNMAVVDQKEDGNCLADDTQLLTAVGFLGVDEIHQRLQHGRSLLVACYDAQQARLEYHPVRAKDVVDRIGPQRLVHFRCEDAQINLLVTADHDMYARVDHAFTTTPAYSLVTSASMSFLTHAANGVVHSHADSDFHLLPFVAPLGLQTDDHVNAALELYAYRLADPSMHSSCDEVSLAPSSVAQGLFLDDIFQRLSAVLPVTNSAVDDDEDCVYIQHRPGSERRYCIKSSSWSRFLIDGAAALTVSPPSTTRTLSSSFASPSPISGSRGIRSPRPSEDVVASSPGQMLSALSGNAEDSRLWCWLREWLSRDQLRLVVSALHRAGADAGTSKQQQRNDGSVWTSSIVVRDELMLLLLHAGYSCHFDRSSDNSNDCWTVQFSDDIAAAQPTLQTARDVQQVSRTTRVWCVTVPHHDHLIVVRRVEGVLSDGRVSAASRPMVVGNCLFRSVSHQLYDSSEYHAVVRDRCMTYLQQEAAYFRAFVVGDYDAYIARMRQDGEWGDHVEIQAMSEVYDMPIEIYAYSTHPLRTYRGEGGAGEGGRGVMRLSYHFASHYNSVVEVGRATGLLRGMPPGMVEDDMIEKRRRRRELAERREREERLQQRSVLLRAEDEELSRGLAVSRSEFKGQASLSDFDRAVAASMRELDDAEERKVEEVKRESEREELERNEMELVLKQSEDELDLNKIEQDDINAALQNSLMSSAAQPPAPAAVSASPAPPSQPLSSSSTSVAMSAAPLDEDEEMKLALELSLTPSMPTTVTASSSSSAVSASSVSGYPSAVRKLLDLGFPLDSCIAAYCLYEGTGGGEEALVQNMMEHLLQQRAGGWD